MPWAKVTSALLKSLLDELDELLDELLDVLLGLLLVSLVPQAARLSAATRASAGALRSRFTVVS
jgi:hypothetical protein